MWILPEQTTGFLTLAQQGQITVLFNALQPGDQSMKVPNAQQAGAVDFLNLLLARDRSVYEDIETWRKLYPPALEELNKQAVKLFGKQLENISAEECTSLIALLENNKLQDFPAIFRQGDLFDMFRRHCIQGCFADPRWGGNKNGIMWKWYGYQEETKEVKLE